MEFPIEIKRETEFYQGFIRLKLSVSNKAPSVMTDVSLDFIFEEQLLRIDHYEPAYGSRNGKILLGNINRDKSKSIAVFFDPLMCTKGTEINCQVTFRDAQGKLSSAFMEAKNVSVICPILQTDSDINIGRLKEFIEKLPSRDSKSYEIPQGFDMSKLISISREVIERHDVKHVRTLHTTDGNECEIWYYGKTKVQGTYIVIRVSISSEKHCLELFATTESAESLTGLLAEVGRDLKQSLEAKAGSNGNIINLTIKDSVVQRSNLLDLCSRDGACPSNIVAEANWKNEEIETEKVEPKQLKREEKETGTEEVRKSEEIRETEAGEKKNTTEIEGTKEKRDTKENREIRDTKENREVRDTKENREIRDIKENRETKEIRKTKPSLIPKNAPKKQRKFSGKGVLFLFAGILIVAAIFYPGLKGLPTDSENSSQNPETYTNSIGMEFVQIPAGEFMMGSSSDEEGRNDNEGPVHKVTFEKPYYLEKYEVTQGQWNAVMGSNPSCFKGDDLPVENVSWNDAQEFIKKLNEMEGTEIYRLPSEAEWEYACRAGTTSSYFFGDNASKLGDYAWYNGFITSDERNQNQGEILSNESTHQVGQKKPNPWGLYDMYGNVWEFCLDKYHSDYNDATSNGSALEDETSSMYVSRGSCWSDSAENCRSARRGSDFPDNRNNILGFRLLMEIS